MLQRALGGLPAPHTLAPALEGAGRKGALGRDPRQHLPLDGAHLGRSLAPPPVPVGQLDHAPLVQRVVLDREQAGLVGPVLEQDAPAQELRHGLLPVGADARHQRQAMGPVDGRDRVELNRAQAPNGIEQVGGAGATEASGVSLVGDDEATKRGGRDRLHGGRG